MTSTVPILRFSILALLVSALMLTPSVAEESEGLTAREILDRMEKTYSSCKSYRDSGVVKTVYITAKEKRTEERPFTTAFVRPDRFRFEYRRGIEGPRGGESRYIVWRNGPEVETWWDFRPGFAKPESLNMGLAGATGVSGGSAHRIPALLLSEVEGRRLTEIKDARRIDDATFDNVDCFRIEGKFLDDPMTLWIDKASFLVRKIDEQNDFGDFQTEETTTYDPVVDGEVPEELLAFNPPEQADVPRH